MTSPGDAIYRNTTPLYAYFADHMALIIIVKMEEYTFINI